MYFSDDLDVIYTQIINLFQWIFTYYLHAYLTFFFVFQTHIHHKCMLHIKGLIINLKIKDTSKRLRRNHIGYFFGEVEINKYKSKLYYKLNISHFPILLSIYTNIRQHQNENNFNQHLKLKLQL